MHLATNRSIKRRKLPQRTGRRIRPRNLLSSENVQIRRTPAVCTDTNGGHSEPNARKGWVCSPLSTAEMTSRSLGSTKNSESAH
jgi:hypothetical protein